MAENGLQDRFEPFISCGDQLNYDWANTTSPGYVADSTVHMIQIATCEVPRAGRCACWP